MRLLQALAEVPELKTKPNTRQVMFVTHCEGMGFGLGIPAGVENAGLVAQIEQILADLAGPDLLGVAYPVHAFHVSPSRMLVVRGSYSSSFTRAFRCMRPCNKGMIHVTYAE